MGSLRPGHWSLILVLILLLQIQPVKVKGVDPVSQKLRRLNEQFQQFQALTQARLNMLAQNQNRNSSGGLESRVKALSENWQRLSEDLDQLKRSSTQEIEGLREWSRKLEKKSKRMEGRLAFMERSLRENRRHAQKQKPDPGQDIPNLTLELQSQDERLGALQTQRDELIVGLKGLQESLNNQALRLTRLEGQVLQKSDGGALWRAEELFNSNITSQEHYEPRRRSKTHRGRERLRLDSEPIVEGPFQYPSVPINRRHSKESRPQQESHLHYSPQPDSYGLQSQIQVPAQKRPYPIQQEQIQSVPYLHTQVRQRYQPKLYRQRHPQLHNPTRPYWSQPLPHSPTYPEPNKVRQSTTSPWPPPPKGSDDIPQPKSESQEETDTKEESSVIHNFLQLPVRHKIPSRPVPKKDATICNVDSLLLFPSASADNFVTFFRTLPNLPELSVCLWLRVEASHVGTLLSYATDDNDNQLVLYGRNSSASSASISASSSFSLDFIIGDPVYRRLPVSSLMDARWHHLCVVWSSIQGRFWHYVDRRLTSSGSHFRKGWEIPGGGSVVLGQEQDVVEGGFDSAEGFAGQIAGFRMWNRVLSASEVEGVAEGRGLPRGVVLGMEDIKEVHGEVQQVACECLEHCVG
ncbi:pentraxin-4 [Trematomus bernacchii]|uniref:pentraxin-4 n=1 Tax=Trematomus bernacchii TaxID=40690 RepID=UPI00146EFA84|nr:pentraxin-4 [Trematomus bernacchii]